MQFSVGWRMVSWALLLGVSGIVGGCAEASSGEAPTYHADIAPMLEQHCTKCHRTGGAGPFDLSSSESARLYSQASLSAIEAGRMPPWMPDPACRSYRDERVMTAAERSLFGAWVRADMPEGEAPEAEPAPEEEVEEAPAFTITHVLEPEGPYLPNDGLTDDYRCFPLNLEIPEDIYLLASQVLPGADNLVHHALVYGVTPDMVSTMESLDAAEEGPGYTCFGGPETGVPHPIGAWVPGMEPAVLDDGVGIHLAANSRVILQVHYNMLSDAAEPDFSRWQVELTSEEPAWLLESLPFPHLDIVIPPGAESSVQERMFKNDGEDPWVVSALGPHMHLLGTRIRVDHVPAEGPESCLVDIPQWDFNWQQTYRLGKGAWVEIPPGDSVRLTCEYDNSQENQAWVNGAQVTPKTVTWGDGTLDEMCLVYLTMIREFEAPTAMCVVYSECFPACVAQGASGYQCLTACMGKDSDCGSCMLPSVFLGGGCINTACQGELGDAEDCLVSCVSDQIAGGSSLHDCMEALCPEERSALDACASPVVDGGQCDGAMINCGASL